MQNNMMPMLNIPMEQHIEHLYPDVYRSIQPFVAYSADNFLRRMGDAEITEEALTMMENDVINQSGIEYTDTLEPEAVPAQLGFGRRGRRHDRNALADIIRILLLRELSDRRRRRHNPFVIFPFI